jgi:Putative prokaryotic signal transducing protein
VVTVRIYWNPAQAALAKSLLDDYEIVSALTDENASLYGRAPMAMPIRLMVLENQAEMAARILEGDVEGIVALQDKGAAAEMETAETEFQTRPDPPWELLFLAFYLLLPGLCVVLIKYPTRFANTGWGRYVIAKIAIFHMFGWLAIAFAVCLVALFWYVQRFPEPAPRDATELPSDD